MKTVFSLRYKHLLFIYVCFAQTILKSQSLGLPIDYPISLAGNYAELRSNHFHMGLDFRTENKENIRILAAADGYIERIVISPNGYGKAIYVNHPSLHLTTVYAHLNAMRPDIEWWISQAQYIQKRNVLDTTFVRPKFYVQKGEFIAFSGNTGSSEGPHLHYEIRNSKTEKTINPLHYYSNIKDTIQPILKSILFYHVDGESIYMDKFLPKDIQNQTLELNSNKVGLAVAAYDKMNNTPNVFGIYILRVYENQILKYQLKLDSLAFDWQGHIKALSDIGVGERDVYKGFFETCSFNVSDSHSPNGIVELNAGERKHIRLEVFDFHGNTSSVEFFITRANHDLLKNFQTMQCKEEQIITDNQSFRVVIPAYGLAENYLLQYKVGKLSAKEIFKVHILDESTAALKPFQLYYNLPANIMNTQKLYLKYGQDKISKTYLGHYQDRLLIFSNLKNYGLYTICLDTQPPVISPRPIRRSLELIFTAMDQESGIADYQLFINGMWRRLYYDEKNNQFIYKIISEDKGKKVKALFEVTDKVGNKKSNLVEILF